MNLVGKIFTVLILLMCVVFGTFALMVHAAQKNWKEQAALLNGQLTQTNQKIADLTQEKTNLETARNDEAGAVPETADCPGDREKNSRRSTAQGPERDRRCAESGQGPGPDH